MAILCVDAGTSVIKTVAFDEGNGRALAAARRPAEVRRPRPGFSEQDMDAVWEAVAATIAEVRQSVAADVRAIAITGQGDGCWLIDRAGRPTGPAILWNDGRAAGIVGDWERAGVLERAFRRNGSLTFAGLPNAILAWLKRHEPTRLAEAHKALSCDGWVFSKLTGEFVAEDSDASAPFYDIRARRYSAELLEWFGLGWAEGLLPDVRPDERRSAPLSRAASAELGLPAGVPVVMAPYDIASMAIGVGAVRPGQACSILGTTLCTEVVTASPPDAAAEPAGLTIAFSPGLYLRAFPTLAGCEIIGWAQRLLGLNDPEDLSRLAAGIEPGAAGLCCLPYLSPAGERAPFFNPAARGVLLGLTVDHDRRHVARALLDGLTFVIRDCFEASKASPADLRVCGGGANSALWCQTIADVTGVPTRRSADAEVGAKGAFIAALVATGAEPDYASAQSRVRIADTFEPDPRRSAQYRELYAQFLSVRDTTAAAWRAMATDAAGSPASHA
jgi:erythritol kinase (D-erythritol 1-phosphate-forming)